MNVLDVFPLLSSVLGLLLALFVLFSKSGLGKNKRIRFVLSSLVFIYAITSLDYYLSINNRISIAFSGFSYLLYHFSGLLLYYFIALYTKSEVNLKKWIPIIIGYTLLRVSVFIPFDESQNIQDFISSLESSNFSVLISVEYFVTSLINILLTYFSYKKLEQTPFVIRLDETQKIHFKWIKIVLLAFVLLQVLTFANNLIGFSDFGNFDYYMKFETLLYAVFLFIFTFSIVHFPVFAYSGNFEDLSEVDVQKYAKSSLEDSSELFKQIETIVKVEELYLDYELKMNMVAEKLDKSIHHISQSINQNAQMSFTDFINSFRIEEAKKKLLLPKPDTIFAISLDVGFNSKAAFYSAFKKITSQTPTEFKNPTRSNFFQFTLKLQCL